MNRHLQWFPFLFVVVVVILLVSITWRFSNNMSQLNKITPHPQFRVALLLEGPSFDQGWNSSALESISRLRDRFSFELQIADQLSAAKITETASQYAAQGYDLVIGHGVAFSEPFYHVAPYYPKTRFITFNGKATYPNQTNIGYDMNDSGYLMGKLSALISKTHQVGYIVANKPNEASQIEWFKRGVASVKPLATVHVKAVGSYNDDAAALKAAQDLIAHRVDVIYTLGDSFNLPVITAAQKANIYAIGYIADQRYIAPNNVLTCIMQDVNMVYTLLLQQYANGTLPQGNVEFGLAEGANRLSPFGPMVPPAVQHEINHELQQIVEKKHVTSGSGGKS
ncbi:BMP family ABC transporter substrate-binding protein [Brevibacillus fluminis]|uniref:BMP family ABC transporter substrate-binding protein n=1 Tax=Brevibacillus fluminis TaxID=511487 RepID=A0A3M8DD52_9BACL|nr:BMP family ABC transporter substrate-binding protein [Brevibacillus fluminis]RNB85928.1 BMP family ABC transporter substrate-binding protein [Brevibacillus fluminis]